MKIINRSIPFLYSIEYKSSHRQLQDDFGEFPPTPLHCEKLSGSFSIQRASRLGEFYIQFLILQKLINISEEDFKNLPIEISDGRSFNQIASLKDTIKMLSFGLKWMEHIWIFLGIFWTLSRSSIQKLKSKSTKKFNGYFNPLIGTGSQIVINSRFHVKKDDAPTVSHEHLHVLQFRNPSNHFQKAQLPDDFFYEEYRSDSQLIYLMKKNEVEARLHEVILSFYRAHRHLPVTVSGFLGLIGACEHCGNEVSSIFKIYKKSFHQYEKYPARDPGPIEQLEDIFISIGNFDILFKFITEVLPVMYGNLLKYYGSDEYSKNYMAEIERPNFYDELYKIT